MLEKDIADYIQSKNDPFSSHVSLPDAVSAGKISYHTITDKPTLLFLFLGIIFAIIVFLLSFADNEKKVKFREEELHQDYPELVSKLLLLTGAGLTIRMAFLQILSDSKKISLSSNHYVFQEIEWMLSKQDNGHSEFGSYAEFGKRCRLHCYIKLGSLLEQNLRKGSSDLHFALKQEMNEAFLQRKTHTLQSGEKAGTKILFPMILLLIVIMAIIMIPAFLSMNSI